MQMHAIKTMKYSLFNAKVCRGGCKQPQCEGSSTTSTSIITSTRIPTYSSTSPPLIRCYPGSQDKRCPEINAQITTTPSVPSAATINTQKYESSTPQIATSRPTIPSKTTTETPDTENLTTFTTPIRCYPGSRDIRCSSSITTTEASETEIHSTIVPLRCPPGTNDPRCLTPKPPYTGSPYLPPEKTTPQTIITTIYTTPTPLRCYPGSTDPRCSQSLTSTTERPVTSRFTQSTQLSISTTQLPLTTRITESPLRCYPESLDIRCPQPSTSTTQWPVTSRFTQPSQPPISTTQRLFTTTSRTKYVMYF